MILFGLMMMEKEKIENKNTPNTVRIAPFSAKVSIGCERGYTKETIGKDIIVHSIQEYQKKLIETKEIYLSVSISDTEIVMSGQREAHLVLHFINYPKFPLGEQKLKKEIEALVMFLMNEFDQNRVVVEYHNETVMLDLSTEIDPRI